MKLRKALPHEANTILRLYRSVLGTEFCVWNEYYPAMDNIREDLASGGLYVLEHDGDIIGAVSVVPENEMDGFDVWTVRHERSKEIARIVVSPAMQGKGLAYTMVAGVLDALRKSGCLSVRLSVACGNMPAYKTYIKLGFQVRDEVELYGGRYYLCERNFV